MSGVRIAIGRVLLDARARREVRHLLVGANVLRPAVGIAAVVERVHADEDVSSAEHLRPRQREREEDRVARRDVRDRHAVTQLAGEPILGNRSIARERRAAEHAEVDVGDDVLSDRVAIGDPARRLDLVRVALPVPKRQRVNRVPLGRRQGEQRGGVEPTAEKENRWTIRHVAGDRKSPAR